MRNLKWLTPLAFALASTFAAACVDDPTYEEQPEDSGATVVQVAPAFAGDPTVDDVDELYDETFIPDLDEGYPDEPDGQAGIMECGATTRMMDTDDVRSPCAPRL